MRLKDISIGTRDLFMLDPAIIQEEPGWNVRLPGPELDAHIRTLADSIKEIGVQEPVTVYLKNDMAILTNGHCRLMAVKLAISEGADIKAIPARAEERYANDADRVLGMLTRNNGKPLTMPEQAEVVKRLLGFGWQEYEIAKKTGYSMTHISNLVSFSAADSEVKDLVSSGKVSATLAVKTVKEKGPEAVDTLKTALKNAEEKGKGKATAKHMPAKDRSDGGLSSDRPANEKDVPLSFAPSTKSLDWQVWGPRCHKYLEKFRDADSVKDLQQMQIDVRFFLTGMAK